MKKNVYKFIRPNTGLNIADEADEISLKGKKINISLCILSTQNYCEYHDLDYFNNNNSSNNNK